MNKTVLTFLFLFGTMIGGYFYLENTYFFEIHACESDSGLWSHEESTCKTGRDIEVCHERNGIWIEEENICDFGEILN